MASNYFSKFLEQLRYTWNIFKYFLYTDFVCVDALPQSQQCFHVEIFSKVDPVLSSRDKLFKVFVTHITYKISITRFKQANLCKFMVFSMTKNL